MPQSLCNFPTNTRSQTNLLLQSEALLAKYPPVEVGTRGTVGSLLMQEIEYFTRLELNSRDRSGKSKSRMKDMGSSGSTGSRANIVSTVASAKKKQGSSSKKLPSMCSMVDVSDISRPNGNGTSAFSYRNLKSDTKNFQV